MFEGSKSEDIFTKEHVAETYYPLANLGGEVDWLNGKMGLKKSILKRDKLNINILSIKNL